MNLKNMLKKPIQYLYQRHQYYTNDVEKYDYNVEKAKELTDKCRI